MRVLGRVIPGFNRLCTISADLKRAAKKSSWPSSAGSYYSVDVVIGMTFGDTEIKAALFWREGVSIVLSLSDDFMNPSSLLVHSF